MSIFYLSIRPAICFVCLSLTVYPSVFMSVQCFFEKIGLSVCPSVLPYDCFHVYQSIQSIYHSLFLFTIEWSISLCACLIVRLFVCPAVCLSPSLSVCFFYIKFFHNFETVWLTNVEYIPFLMSSRYHS